MKLKFKEFIGRLHKIEFLTNDEDITNSGSESVSLGILDVDNVKATGMSLTGHDGPHSASVTSSGDHAKVARVELDSVLDLAGGDVYLDRVVHLGDRTVLQSLVIIQARVITTNVQCQ